MWKSSRKHDGRRKRRFVIVRSACSRCMRDERLKTTRFRPSGPRRPFRAEFDEAQTASAANPTVGRGRGAARRPTRYGNRFGEEGDGAGGRNSAIFTFIITDDAIPLPLCSTHCRICRRTRFFWPRVVRRLGRQIPRRPAWRRRRQQENGDDCRTRMRPTTGRNYCVCMKTLRQTTSGKYRRNSAGCSAAAAASGGVRAR